MQNEMRERLIDVLANSGCSADIQTFEELADHLIANGVILPPCKVGDSAFLIFHGNIFPFVVDWFKRDRYFYQFRMSYCGQNERLKYWALTMGVEAFGDTVFLTREDAEQALKEGAKT